MLPARCIAGLPIIALSALTSADAIERGRQAGFHDYVAKFDRPGLLLAITRALFRANVQIIASDAGTRSGRVVDRFSICESDGTPIRNSRRGIVQIEVLGAIDALSH